MPDFNRISKRLLKGAANLEDVVRIYQALLLLPGLTTNLENGGQGNERWTELIEGLYLVQLRVRPAFFFAHSCAFQVSLKRPHAYARNTGVIEFGLKLEHKAPTGFGHAKEVRVYSCLVDLVQRTPSKPGVGKQKSIAEEARNEDEEEGKLKESEVVLRCELDAFPPRASRELTARLIPQSTNARTDGRCRPQ